MPVPTSQRTDWAKVSSAQGRSQGGRTGCAPLPWGFRAPGTKQGPGGQSPARAKNPGGSATEPLTKVPKCSLKPTRKARLDDQAPLTILQPGFEGTLGL